jgi:hypothetical protein
MYNPVRRSRNIGTAKQGHGQNNNLIIPYPCVVAKSFFERLGPYEKAGRQINGHSFTFVIESTREFCKHACSIADIEKIIENIPAAHYGALKLIVLRQPKRKEEILSPVWGRLIYSYEFEGHYHPAIILEAVDLGKRIRWPKSLSVDNQKELDRLKRDGHPFIETKREFVAPLLIENVRNTQLYRTLPHEFGHYVQYFELVEKPLSEDEDCEARDKRDEAYNKIPVGEKEKYAHSYADELLEKLTTEKVVPFEGRS